MLHPVVLLSESHSVTLAGHNRAEKLLLAMDRSLMAPKISGVAEIANFAVEDATFERPLMLVHVPPFHLSI